MEEIVINSDVVSEICGYIRAGATLKVSLLAAGFKQDQISEMVDVLSKATEGIWKEFSEDIQKAFAQFEVMQLMKINAEGGAKGSQWLLERKDPKKWEKDQSKKKGNTEDDAISSDWGW